MSEWFKSLSDISGIDYTSDARVKRTSLPGHDAVPKRYSFDFQGQKHESLLWPTNDGETTSSPASQHASSDPSRLISSEDRIRRLSEVLELPGCPADYHFAIQHCLDELWKQRREYPPLLEVVEHLCWLDIRLIELRPEIISFERDGATSYYHVLAFGYLIHLYEREGFLDEALDVANRAAKFNAEPVMDRLRERIASIQAEA